MKRAFLAVFIVTAGLRLTAATNDLTAVLQKGLFEEEANRNLDAAIASYQSAISGYDSDRPLAATAVFRLGECYRKLGRTNEANAQYQRVIRDFPEQDKLVALARSYLSNGRTGGPSTFAQNLRRIQDDEEQKQLAKTEEMIKTSPDLINSSIGGGLTPLEEAAITGQLEVARVLLDNGADPTRAGDENPPLCAAANNGRKEMVELLLNRGADVNVRDPRHKTALDYAAENGFLNVGQILLDHHAEPGSSLSVAFAAGQDKMAKLLLDRGAPINSTNQDGETPLISAIKSGREAMVDLALNSGADANLPATDGTPLETAIRGNRVQSVEALLSHGANPNVHMPYVMFQGGGSGPGRGPNPHSITPLILTLEYGKGLEIEKILLAHKADPNLGDEDGLSPLDYGILKGNVPFVQILIEAHANVNASDKDGDPPLAYVERLASRADIVSAIRTLLVKAGANQNYLRLRGIHVTQKGSGLIGRNVAPKNDDMAPPTVLEVIAHVYADYGTGAVAFPDLSHLTLDRLHEGINESRSLDVASVLASGDCAKLPTLEWGDVLEIPQNDHRLGESWNGFSKDQMSNLVHCTMRTVSLVIKGQTNALLLLPPIARAHAVLIAGGPQGVAGFGSSPTGDVGVGASRFWRASNFYTFDLNEVVHGSDLLLLSSDLAHVTVRGRDGNSREFNLEGQPAARHTLQEGDEIVIPEKPS